MSSLKRAVWPVMLALIALSLGYGCATAAQPAPAGETQEDWRFHTVVDVEFVKQYATIPQPEGVMIVDSRPYQPKYVEGHIPGAVSIPFSQLEKTAAALPEDKETMIIFYCGGLECKLSHKSARVVEGLGYTNVKVFAAGFPEWLKTSGSYASVSAEYVAREMEANKMVLVDSRPKKAKFDTGHIPTAISIPDSEFDELKGKLPADKHNLLVFYCGGYECKLSHKSAAKAIGLGYTNVKVFAAGYPGWKEYAGTDGAVAVKAGKEEGSIDIAVFRKTIEENPESIFLVDSRDPDEFAKGSFKTAINIPVDKLEEELGGLPADKPIVFVCSTGARSGESYYMVQDLRPSLDKVYYLDAKVVFNGDGSFEISKNVE